MKLKARFIAAALVATACGVAENATENSTVTVAGAISDAQDTEIPMELELVMGPLADARRWEHEGLRCDTEPERTTAEVCGKTIPAELHLAWSDCQVRGRGGHHGRPHGPPPGDAGATSQGDGSRPAGKPAVTSTGTVDTVTTPDPLGSCDESGPLQLQQQATHDIRHTTADGQAMVLAGTVSSVVTRASGSTNHNRASTVNLTRTQLDAEGNTVESFHVEGTLGVAVDHSGETPSHTLQGSLTVTRADEGTSTVTLSDIVRAPPPVCAWPLSGTMQQVAADGATHVLSFGPECGQATLDGAAITLPSRGHGPGGPGGHGPGGRDGQRPDGLGGR